MFNLYILMSPSGCGKSTFAKKIQQWNNGIKICSADNFFMVDGEYKWDRNLIGKAHETCRNECEAELKVKNSVIVDNTNTTWKELKPYIQMGYDNNACVLIYRPKVNLTVAELAARNVHNVPVDAIQAMKDRFIGVEDLKNKIDEEFPHLIYTIAYFENK